MDRRKSLAIVALMVMIGLFLGFAEYAVAQNDSAAARSLDKEIASRRGVSGSLAPIKKEDDGEGPTKLQMAIGIGSVFVMIAVVKWL